MKSPGPAFLLVAIAVLGAVVYRQLQARPLNRRKALVLPGLLVVVGAIALARTPGLGENAAAWVALDGAVGVLMGLARAPSVRLFERDGVIWRQGGTVTLALWGVSVGVRVVIAVLGSAHGAGKALDSSFVFSFGLSLSAQYLMLDLRARRRLPSRRYPPG